MTNPEMKVEEKIRCAEDFSKPPLCPACKAELTTLGAFSWTIPPNWLILAVYCRSCRVLLRMEVLPLTVMGGGDRPEPPRIAGPF